MSVLYIRLLRKSAKKNKAARAKQLKAKGVVYVERDPRLQVQDSMLRSLTCEAVDNHTDI